MSVSQFSFLVTAQQMLFSSTLALECCMTPKQQFLLQNKLFDILNAKQPYHGLQLDSSDFKLLESSLQWLDTWQMYVTCLDREKKNQCLSPSTFQGLRVTLLSTIQLSQYLLMLPDAPFIYILTSRFGQDPLVHFFGLLYAMPLVVKTTPLPPC